MKISARLMVGLLAASLTFGIMGCNGQPPEPPVAAGQDIVVSNGAHIKVDSFEILRPDFLDAEGKAVHPVAGQEEVAVLRLNITNTSGAAINYRPLHFSEAKSRVQLCTDPDPVTGKRADIRAIAFANDSQYHTKTQKIDTSVSIPAGSSITDEYLFEVPAEKGDLVVLIPDAIVGAGEGKVLRSYVHEAKAGDNSVNNPVSLGKALEIDGMAMTVSSIKVEYAELVPKTAPASPLKYAYAYTKDKVIAVRVSIKNNDSKPHAYDPSHNSAKTGISLKFAGSPLNRVKFDNALGKDQVVGKIAINPGETKKDVYFFEVPASNGECLFEISGHVLTVPGIYRYALNLELSDPAQPNLDPWKNPDATAAADADAEGEEAEGDEEEGEEAEGEEAEGEEAAADAPAADAAAPADK